MNVTVKISLSEAGRKANLLAGGTADQNQVLTVPQGANAFAVCFDRAKLVDGQPVWDRTTWEYGSHDTMPTIAEVLAMDAARSQAKADEDAAELACRRADVQIVLDIRKVKKSIVGFDHGGSGISGHATYDELSPDWPYYRSGAEDIVDSPTAQTWIAELGADNAERKAAAEVAAKDDWTAKIEAARVKAEATAKLRAERGCREGDISYNVESGALCRSPCYSNDRRAKNWMAVISVDASKPGGLDRSFVAKARGEYLYLISELSVGDAIEFGADDYNSRGRKSPTRWYGYVVKITDTYVILHEESTGKAAVKAAAKFLKDNPRQPDAVDAAIARVNNEGAIIAQPSAN